MPLDFGNLGKNLGNLANAAKDAALDKAKEAMDQRLNPQPPVSSAPPRQSDPAPSSSNPSVAGTPVADAMGARRVSERDAYGSARLLYRAGTPLAPVLDLDSSSIIMGSDELNGSTGYVWDLSRSPAHAMTFGPTRKGGKGTSSIVPALLSYRAGSSLTIDPKAENFWIVAPRLRETHRVVLMDPWNEANRRYGSKVGVTESVTKFNPLSSLDPTSQDFADDVAAIADALIMVPDTANRHFDESARELIAGCVAAVVEESRGTASLRDVREMLIMDDSELATVIQRVVTADPDSLAGRKLRRFTRTTDEISSVRSTAETQTAFLDSETLLDAMETGDPPFDLAELATGKIALFLVLPVDRLETHGRWMRLIITLAIRAIARQNTPPKNPVLFLLDEMGTIGRLSMVETAFGLMAGLGIRLWGFLQDLVQLQGLYPRTWETFISNSSVVQILKAHDPTTSEYVSKYLGNGTVNAKTGGWSYKQTRWQPGEFSARRVAHREKMRQFLATKYPPGKQFDEHEAGLMQTWHETEKVAGRTEDYNLTWVPDEQLIARPLLDPDEVRRLADEHCLLLIPGADPVRQFRTVYYKHPLFAGTYRPNPYFDLPAAAPPS